MVKVLVFGAAGYIGSATALALRRAGHTVWGVSRSGRCLELEQNEVEVLKGDINELKGLEKYIDDADVVIDNVMDNTKWFAANAGLLKAVESAPKRLHGEKRRYVYTSGGLVFGDSPGKLLIESDPLKHPSPLIKGRIDFEAATIKSTDAVGTVVRPGFVYGGKSSELTGWMQPNKNGEWVLEGSADKMWGWIHVTDLADLYVKVVEASSSVVGGHIFNAADSTRLTYSQFRTGLARAAGFKGELIKGPAPKEGFLALCECTVVFSSQKATKLLGWVPKHGPFGDDYYEIVYKAWKANQISK